MTARFSQLPPLALYIHVPWCVKKCPYCDFNSHVHKGNLPIADYVDALKQDLDQDLEHVQGRKLSSIFFGGGTPSLMPATAVAEILDFARQSIGFEPDIEISLEANPGTTEYDSFSALAQAGVNRLSIGIQSFNDKQLQGLGRIHSSEEARRAVTNAQAAGFNNINLDLMYALPEQSLAEALDDLEQAMSLGCSHQSWYQLTIEPNTEFYSRPPRLPTEGRQWEIQEAGLALLETSGFERYEVSAFCRAGRPSRHNLNYWQFGDYLGIGAGAHAKISHFDRVLRFHKTRLPTDYLARKAGPTAKFVAQTHTIDEHNLLIDFMMNALRLRKGVASELLEQRTGIKPFTHSRIFSDLRERGLLKADPDILCCSDQGYNFLDSILQAFLED